MSIRQGSTIIAGSSGSGGTSNYNNLENKPSINGITLEGNKTTEDLNINSLPDQTGNEGKVLITNGTEASWQTLPETGLPLFAHIWSDHLLTNSSYLRADTFSWQDGNIYYTAYNELVNEKNLTTKTSTDTINNITITYYRTPKGYKIVLPDMADNLVQLYENTGTAWYYILDTDNTRFKLPRNSRYESGTTTELAGNFEAETLTNSTNNETNLNHITQFLYFYVGNTIQNETTINVAEITEALNNKADRDFGNITDGTYDFLTTKQVSNCITKIPQDIKLELVDETLTLKAGSKMYVPNGPGVFDEVVIQSDISEPAIVGYSSGLIFYSKTNNSFNFWSKDDVFSGTEQPSESSYIWYNPDTGILKRYSNNVDTGDILAFPIGEFTGTWNLAGYRLTSINQVFNGFGYIGSTIFALPGIEGLVPNGRNEDGSLNNTKFTTTKVSTRTYGSNETYTDADLVISSSQFTTNYAKYYNDKNLNIDTLGRTSPYANCGMASFVNGRITSFALKTTFQAVDRNDTEWASTAGKPSDRYIDLTLGASGTQYTAPANGWLYLAKKATEAGQYIYMGIVGDIIAVEIHSSSTEHLQAFIPCKKGKTINVTYTAGGTATHFRFIYDEGSK